jgi:uncharacterized lipoprotein YajG
MQLEPIIALIVLFLAVASFLVAGCTRTTAQTISDSSAGLQVTVTKTPTVQLVTVIKLLQ